MFRFVAKEYGQDNKQNEELTICPGEENCEKFQSTPGKARELKELKICIGGEALGNGKTAPGCPLFPSKVRRESAEKSEKRLQQILNKAIALRQERDSNFPFYPEDESAIVAQIILVLDAQTRAFERNLKLENRQLLEMLLKKPTL